MELKVINKSNYPLPEYATTGSSGMDLRANVEEAMVIKPMQRGLVGTGLYISVPQGFEAQIRPRSGFALKQGITVLNSPGTIDSDYRGEIKVLLINLSQDDVVVNGGDRIAQLVVAPYTKVTWLPTDNLEVSERGTGGYGSTGLN